MQDAVCRKPSIVVICVPSATLTGTEQRPGRHPVDMDRAGAALGDAASEFGAGQTQGVAQDPKQRGVGIDVDLVRAVR